MRHRNHYTRACTLSALLIRWRHRSSTAAASVSSGTGTFTPTRRQRWQRLMSNDENELFAVGCSDWPDDENTLLIPADNGNVSRRHFRLSSSRSQNNNNDDEEEEDITSGCSDVEDGRLAAADLRCLWYLTDASSSDTDQQGRRAESDFFRYMSSDCDVILTTDDDEREYAVADCRRRLSGTVDPAAGDCDVVFGDGIRRRLSAHDYRVYWSVNRPPRGLVL